MKKLKQILLLTLIGSACSFGFFTKAQNEYLEDFVLQPSSTYTLDVDWRGARSALGDCFKFGYQIIKMTVFWAPFGLRDIVLYPTYRAVVALHTDPNLAPAKVFVQGALAMLGIYLAYKVIKKYYSDSGQ